MFASTLSVEAGSSPSATLESQKAKRTRRARRAKASLASFFACLLTLGTAAAGHAQTVTITGPTTQQAPMIEGSGGTVNADFRVALTSAPSAPVTVNVATFSGTATAGEDFTTTTQTITFPTGFQGPVTVSVPVIGDDIYEANGSGPNPDRIETFTLEQVNDTGNRIPNGAVGTAHIQDDDNIPLIFISDAPPIVEGNSGAVDQQFTVTLSGRAAQAITVQYRAEEDPDAGPSRATADTDFQAVSNILSIPAGATSAIINVPIIGDTVDEGSETYLVTLSNASGAQLAQSTARGIITDDDGPQISVSSDPSLFEGDDFYFTVTLSAPSPETVSVNYATADRSAVSGPNGDYTATSGTITFLPGETAVDVLVRTADDETYEGNEIFVFNLSGPSNGATLADSQGVGTIQDNDPFPTISVSPVQKEEGNTGFTNFTFRIVLDRPSALDATVQFNVTPGSPNPAQPGSDYRSLNLSGTVQFRPGDTVKSIDVQVIGDTEDETDEQFNVTLSNPIQARFEGNAATLRTTGTIIDDDGPVITFASTDVRVNEGGSGSRPTATFNVQLNKQSNQTVTVNYTTAPGTVRPAKAGEDYDTTSGTLTFTPGVTSRPITVRIKGDTLNEGDETFRVVLSKPSGGTLTNVDTAVGTIIDDDDQPTISVSNFTGNEGNGGTTSFPFVLSLNRASSQTITVAYATAPLTATADIDYTTTSGTATFNPGVTRQTINVRVVGDLLDEQTESFRLNLSDPINATLAGTTFGVGNIRDDDKTPELRINRIPSGIDEDTDPAGDADFATIRFQVDLSNPSGLPVTFRYQASEPKTNSGPLRPASRNSDFGPGGTSVSGTVTIAPGATFGEIFIPIGNDDLDEYDEYFSVAISQATNATIGRATTTGIIFDDDEAGTVSIDAPDDEEAAIESAEGITDNYARFPVELSEAAGRDIRVFYRINGEGRDNPATPGFDVAPVNGTRVLKKETSGSIVIPAGQTTGEIVIAGLLDQLDEADLEDYRVTITNIDPDDWKVANAADRFAVSTVEDRNPGFTSFARAGGGVIDNDGNQEYSDGNNATEVVLTGNQFVIDDVLQVQRVLFGVIASNLTRAVAVERGDINVVSPTELRVRVPDGAVSGKIRIQLVNGRVLTPSGNNADRNFYVNAVATGFSPDRGIPRSTVVDIRGINFNDPNNRVTGVRFNGVLSNANTAGVDFKVFKQGSETLIRATVPEGATTGPVTIETDKGRNYPASIPNFNVDVATPGGIEFVEASGQDVIENATGTTSNPVGFYTLRLNPAVSNGPGNPQVAPRSDVTVEVTVTAPNGALPEIASPSGRVVRRTGQRFEVTFSRGAFENKIISLVFAGDDVIQPEFVNAPFQAQTPVPVTLRARILRSNDTNYPVPAAGAFEERIWDRFDLHGLDTDIGTNLRTTEDQNSPGNITSFKLNLRNINNGVDVAPDERPIRVGKKYSNNPQETTRQSFTLNPDGTVNTDAEPTSDVTLPFEVNDEGEALIRYYVMVPIDGDGNRNGFRKVYPNNDATFRKTAVLIYATDPKRDEYYKYDHFMEVKGVDDNIQDGSQEYQINLIQRTDENQNSNSTDPEFFQLKLIVPFTLVNTDNEQSQGAGEPGFIFTPTSGDPALPRLTVNEAGSQSFFRVRLRTKPTGKVVLRLQSGDPSEVLIVDPTDPNRNTKVETLDLTFLADSNGSNAKETRWDTPITVRFAGVNDDELDGNQDVTILTTVASNSAGTLTTDSAYRSIDPIDPIVTNQDNEAVGVTVSTNSLFVDEGAVQDFTVRLNSRPTQSATINVTSLDPSVASVTVVNSPSAGRIVFTPENWTEPQIVRVRGVADSTFTPQRNTTIQLSNVQSGDPDLANLDVPDVAVTVFNQTQAVLVEPARVLTTGVTTTEDGGSDSFTVRLSNAPTAPVLLTLTTSSGEATLTSGPNRGNSITLTFTPQDFSRTQTVTVTGVDDETTDGNVAFNINGVIQSADPSYNGQVFASISGINQDNDGASTGNGISFAANGNYTVSFPYASGSSASATLTPAKAFSLASGSGTPQFTLYKFNVSKQRNSRELNGGSDFVVVGANETLQRGVGYRLVTGNNDIVMNQGSSGLSPYAGTEFSLSLSWNNNYIADTSAPDNSKNGYNFIGFPFDPEKYKRVAFSTSQVTYGSETYETVTDAAAAGIIDQQLFTVDATGRLSPVSDGNLRPYRAYFVRILRNDRPVTLKLRNPSN